MNDQLVQDFKRSDEAEYWRNELNDQMPEKWRLNIDQFETEIFLKKQNKIDDKVFAETRLRMGAYGQRYDNNQRHDGSETRPLNLPNSELTKGPGTLWNAPGMLRIKIPYGGTTAEQMRVIADIAEEYSDCIVHITTRQDIQFHFMHIEDMPSIFRRLAATGITTQEACGNSVRNITACPTAGVCNTESFDVTPYADAMFRFLLGHPDAQDFGRKFKIAFSGCQDKPCGLTNIHDLGLIAVTREIDGKKVRGFQYYVGGGLGAVPHYAKLLSDFVTEDELLPLTQAVCRIFARHGEKQKRAMARVKFLIKKWGIDKFREEVFAERAKLSEDPRWTDYIPELEKYQENPYLELSQNNPELAQDSDFQLFVKHNVEAQKQAGYHIVHIALPLGDASSDQYRALADIAEKYVKDNIRTSVEQNLVFRWVRQEDLYAVYQELKKIHLADPHYGTILDITACPGTDTCKLGNSASRGLAGELRNQLAESAFNLDEAVQSLKIKVSGCFNSCGQQHISDIGFYGIGRKVGNHVVPHFQLLLGGQWQNNGGSYGLAIGAIPSKAIPDVVRHLSNQFIQERDGEESFQDFVKRKGKAAIKQELAAFMQVPSYEEDANYFTDWGDVREFTTSDIGIGECAGEVVSLVDFGIKAAEREVFEAQLLLDQGKIAEANSKSFQSMLTAAQGLLKAKDPDISSEAQIISERFRKEFYDTEIFFDPFAGDKFANYLFKAERQGQDSAELETVRQLIEEAQLFIEATISCNIRMSMN